MASPITNRRLAPTSGPDFYPTPAWATAALLQCETFTGAIYEPACGNGAMLRILQKYSGQHCYGSDINPPSHWGIETPVINVAPRDFLTQTDTVHDNIVTNPPYNLAEQFAQVGLRYATHKLALLMRLAWLEGADRHNTLWSKHSPARVWVFSNRITFYPNGERTAGSGTTAYAWIVWDKQYQGIDTQLKWIPPGFNKREW